MSSRYLKLTYEILEGYKNLLTRKLQDTATSASYYLQCCLMNVNDKEFIGRMAQTAPIPLVPSLQGGAVQCNILECVYFYSEHRNKLILLIIELIASANDVEQKSLGWSYYKVFEPTKSSPYDKEAIRLPMYEGSPRMLFALPDPFDVGNSFNTIPGCILTIAVQSHMALQKVVHLFPEHVIMTTDDVIPGIVDSSTQDDILLRPKLAKTITASVDKLSIPLLPSVEEYEMQLIQCLSDDLPANGVQLPINNLTIQERRLKIGIHNGWSYVNPPHLLYLQRGFLQSGRHVSSVNRETLVLRGSLELTELVDNPHFVMILELEYLVKWGTGEATGSTPVVIGWTVWQIFNSNHQWQSSGLANVVLDLKAGPGFKPPLLPSSAWTMCYQIGLRDLGKVSFRIYTDQKALTTAHHSETQVSFHSSSDNEEVDGGSLHTTPLHKPQSKTMEYGTQTFPSESLMNNTTASTGTQYPAHQDSDTVSITHRIIGTHPGGRGKIPRQVTAVLNTVGYPPLSDGGSIVDHSDCFTIINLSKELMDPMKDSKIAFQFLALSLSGCCLMGMRPPSHLLISTQFYQLAPSSTHQLNLQPCSSNQSDPLNNDLLIITCGNGKSATPGTVLQFAVNEEIYQNRSGYQRFFHHLYHHCLPVDLWDGDSLCLLGSAQLPLRVRPSIVKSMLLVLLHGQFLPSDSTQTYRKIITKRHYDRKYYLLRQSNSDGVQSTVCVNILSTDYDHNDSTDITVHIDHKDCHHMQETGHRCIGQLYIKMANIITGLDSVTTTQGSLLLKHNQTKRQKTSNIRIRKLTEEHPEVESLLKQNNNLTSTVELQDDTQKRKLARMEAVRKLRAEQKSNKQESDQLNDAMENNLQTIHNYRMKLQSTKISNLLSESVTSRICITAHVIQTTFLEHTIVNPYDTDITTVIEWHHSSLKVVTDTNEWRHMNNLHSNNTAMCRELFTMHQSSSHPTIHMSSMEVIQVPFKFTCLEVPPVPLGSSEDVKVTFTTSSGQLISVLVIVVTYQSPPIDRFLHIFHSDNVPMNKKLMVTTSHDWQTGPISVACSGGQVKCEMLPQVNRTSPQCVFMKANLESTPAILEYYLTFYRDKNYLDPFSVWKVMVHSVHRLTVMGTQGQTSHKTVKMKGRHTCQSIRLASSHQEVLEVSPNEITHLDTFNAQEIHLLLRPSTTGVVTCIISAIDPIDNTLLEAWLVTCMCKEPTVTKVLKTNLPASYNKPVAKYISISNSSQTAKQFHIFTDKPKIVQVITSIVEIPAKEKASIELHFLPQRKLSTISQDVLIFVNDKRDLTVECFLLQSA